MKATDLIGCIMFVCSWLAGIVLAAGPMKLVAIFFFPYAWYLLAERIMQIMGVMP